jgi:YfiH family protein
VIAGVADRALDWSELLRHLPSLVTVIEAEQVHGGSLAVVEGPIDAGAAVAGCDALMTRRPGVALLIRSADCLPIFFADPMRGTVGIAHAGWRGLAAELPTRMVGAFHHTSHTPPHELHVAIGPAIRPCCYDVGAEFPERFGPFVHAGDDRHMCDLVGIAVAQLTRCGVRPAHLFDTKRCTACEPNVWFSLRRQGPATGRLLSFILLRP